MIIQQLPW